MITCQQCIKFSKFPLACAILIQVILTIMQHYIYTIDTNRVISETMLK